jgi:MFS family permease
MEPTLTHRQVLVVFSGLLLVMLLAALDSTIVSTALPTIVGDLGGLDHLAWVVTAYLLAQTIVTPIYGKLGDLCGRKLVLQAGVVLFLAGSALCGLSQSMTQLIAFRFVQGLGGGGLMVTSQAVVGEIVPPRDRGRYQGFFGAVFGLASIAGPLLGGFFTTHLSWRWIFYVNIPLGVVALVVLVATLPARAERRAHVIDYAGSALLAVVLSAVTLLADLGGGTYAWTSTPMIGMILSAAAALAGFVVVELRAAEPVLPPRLFGERAFSITAAVGLIVGFALFGSVTYFPVFLQVVKGVSPTASGMQMLPMMGGMLTPAARGVYATAFTGALNTVFFVAASVCVVGFVLTWLMPERPLRATAAASAADTGSEIGEAFARPEDESSAEEQLAAALLSLDDRAVQRQHIERIVQRAGETLSALAAWLLVRTDRDPSHSPFDVGRERDLPTERVRGAVEELRSRFLIRSTVEGDARAMRYQLTSKGCDVLDLLTKSRRAHLSELAAGWDPGGAHAIEEYLVRAVADVLPNSRREEVGIE